VVSRGAKTVRNALAAGLGITVSEALEILSRAGVRGDARAEELSVDEYLELGRRLLEATPRR
jgi:ribosomal protein S13